MNSIFVSIIIPTYNDWDRLALCIDALAGQTFPSDMFEVIVVNNNFYDQVPPNISLPCNSKIITEKTPGSYAARNSALRMARGEIIGFTDSDCIPDENWIKNAVSYFVRNDTCSRIGGKVSIFFEDGNAGYAELYDQVFAFNQQNYVESDGTCVTANLFARKYVFDKIGYFDEKLMSGGDFLWGMLAQKNGYEIHYVENVVVKHPARRTVKELVKKERRVGGSQAIFLEGKRSTVFNVIKFIEGLRPRLSTLKLIANNGKGFTASDKIRLFLLRHYLLSVRAYERLRVQMGKKANRV